MSQARRKVNRAEAKLLDEQRIVLREKRRERRRGGRPAMPTMGELLSRWLARRREGASRP